MSYEKFVEDYLKRGLLQKQKVNWKSIYKLLNRCQKDLKTAKLNLSIDEGIAYTIAYLAMLRAARAYMLMKGLRPADGYQHRTIIEFLDNCLGKDYSQIISRFDRMRRKRNIFVYDVGIPVSRTEAEAAIRIASKFIEIMRQMIKKESNQLNFNFE